jgi:hypothetical protein
MKSGLRFRGDILTIRKLKFIDVQFKGKNHYVKLAEFRIKEHSGYLLFKGVHSTDDIYVCAIAENRRNVLRELMTEVMDRLHWTSKVSLVNSSNKVKR